MAKYVCSVCGYVYDEEAVGVKFSSLPEDWKCPLCGAPKSAFRPVEEEKPAEEPAEKPRRYVCSVCGYVYDEEAEGVKFSSLPEDWKCPLCGAPKSAFRPVEEEKPAEEPKRGEPAPAVSEHAGDLKKLSARELSAVFSNLAKGCEKQYLAQESKLYAKLADYYRNRAEAVESDFRGLRGSFSEKIDNELAAAGAAAEKAADRGALRAVVWNRKVSNMLKALLERYEREGDAMLENTKIYVCEICGFIYVGDNPPEICPVCKVPGFKLIQVRRGA